MRLRTACKVIRRHLRSLPDSPYRESTLDRAYGTVWSTLRNRDRRRRRRRRGEIRVAMDLVSRESGSWTALLATRLPLGVKVESHAATPWIVLRAPAAAELVIQDPPGPGAQLGEEE